MADQARNLPGNYARLLARAQRAGLKSAVLRGRIDLLATDVLGLTLLPFHARMLSFCHRLYTQSGEGLLLAPRGFGKSSLATVCFALWLMLRDRNIRILIASSTATKAESFVREIKNHLQTNATVRCLFGDVVDESCWRCSEISLRGRTRPGKEATLTARGWSGAVVGLHFDVHLIDDLVNEDNARTKGQRDKLKDWVYMSLEPTLEPHGCRLITGTRYHPDDFYAHTLRVLAGLRRDDEEELCGGLRDPGDQGETGDHAPPLPPSQNALASKAVQRLQALQPDGTSLWPAKFPVAWLHRKRERMGRLRFNAQYQNDCELMQGKIFGQADVRHYDRSALSVSALTVVQGVDLAIGAGPTHDYFALVTKGYDAQGRAYTLDIVRGRYTFAQQMVLILYKAGYPRAQILRLLGLPSLCEAELAALFVDQPPQAKTQHEGVARIGVEAVAYQRVLPQQLLQRVPSLPVTYVPQRLDKRSRMTIYSARFENHLELLPNDDSCDALVEELLLFPDAPHDDLLDAHEIAHRVGDPLLRSDGSNDDTQVRVFT